MERSSGVERTVDGYFCLDCGMDVFNGCDHYHGEWECADCGEWTYPFHYEITDGCQWCGSKNVSTVPGSDTNGITGPTAESGIESGAGGGTRTTDDSP